MFCIKNYRKLEKLVIVKIYQIVIVYYKNYTIIITI